MEHRALKHRAAFWTIRAEEAAGASELFYLTGSKPEDIGAVMAVDEVGVEKQRQALDCDVTYKETIPRSVLPKRLSNAILAARLVSTEGT